MKGLTSTLHRFTSSGPGSALIDPKLVPRPINETSGHDMVDRRRVCLLDAASESTHLLEAHCVISPGPNRLSLTWCLLLWASSMADSVSLALSVISTCVARSRYRHAEVNPTRFIILWCKS